MGKKKGEGSFFLMIKDKSLPTYEISSKWNNDSKQIKHAWKCQAGGCEPVCQQQTLDYIEWHKQQYNSRSPDIWSGPTIKNIIWPSRNIKHICIACSSNLSISPGWLLYLATFNSLIHTPIPSIWHSKLFKENLRLININLMGESLYSCNTGQGQYQNVIFMLKSIIILIMYKLFDVNQLSTNELLSH